MRCQHILFYAGVCVHVMSASTLTAVYKIDVIVTSNVKILYKQRTFI